VGEELLWGPGKGGGKRLQVPSASEAVSWPKISAFVQSTGGGKRKG